MRCRGYVLAIDLEMTVHRGSMVSNYNVGQIRSICQHKHFSQNYTEAKVLVL